LAICLSQSIITTSSASLDATRNIPQYHCIKNVVRHAGVRIKGYTYATGNQNILTFYSGLNARFTHDPQPYITSYSTACFDIKEIFNKRLADVKAVGNKLDINGFKIDVKASRDCKLWVLEYIDSDYEIAYDFLDGYIQYYKIKGPAGFRYCKTEEVLSPEEHILGNFI